MNRRTFIKNAGFAVVAVVAGVFSHGCVAPKVDSSAYDDKNGDPWRCEFCGHLTRSKNDLSETRCPRCMKKKLRRITEEEFRNDLSEAS